MVFLAAGTLIKICVVAALAVGGYFFFRKRKKVETHGPLVLIHTQRFTKFIDALAKGAPRFWKVLSTFGIFFGFIWMILITSSVLINAKNFLFRPELASKALMVVIPGITTPFVGGIIGIIIMAIIHEFSHGIIARVEKIRLDSVGALFLGFIPLGAFVKPSQKELNNSRPMSQLRVYQAGSFANIVLSILLIILAATVILPLATQELDGIKLLVIEENSPAEQVGLEEGMILTSLNGMPLHDMMDVAVAFEKTDLQPGDEIELVTREKSYKITAEDVEGQGRIGISFCGRIPAKNLILGTILNPLLIKNINPECYPISHPAVASVFWYVFRVLAWVIILNMGVGIFNLLPIKPLDGGLMVESVLNKFLKKKIAKKAVIIISIAFFAVLLLNFIGPLFI